MPHKIPLKIIPNAFEGLFNLLYKCDIDDFCKEYDQYLKTSLLIENTENKYE
jgi:hypothetical protein